MGSEGCSLAFGQLRRPHLAVLARGAEPPGPPRLVVAVELVSFWP